MEPEGSLPHSQDPATSPYPEPYLTSLKSNLCTALTTQNTTASDCIISHAQESTDETQIIMTVLTTDYFLFIFFFRWLVTFTAW